jgi:hypothetical protein
MSFITPSATFDVRPEQQFIRRELTQFEIDNLREQQRRLNFFTDKTNEERKQAQEQEVFINLSLVQLFRNLSQTIIQIINDLLEVNQETPMTDVILIFIKRDRLIYVGMVFLIIAFSIYIINATS